VTNSDVARVWNAGAQNNGNNFTDVKYYEIHAIVGDKDNTPAYFYGIGTTCIVTMEV